MESIFEIARKRCQLFYTDVFPPEGEHAGIFKEESLECPLSELSLSAKMLLPVVIVRYRPKKPSPFILYYALAKYAHGRASALLSLDEIFCDRPLRQSFQA